MLDGSRHEPGRLGGRLSLDRNVVSSLYMFYHRGEKSNHNSCTRITAAQYQAKIGYDNTGSAVGQLLRPPQVDHLDGGLPGCDFPKRQDDVGLFLAGLHEYDIHKTYLGLVGRFHFFTSWNPFNVSKLSFRVVQVSIRWLKVNLHQ